MYAELDKSTIGQESQYQDLQINKDRVVPGQGYEVMPSPKLSPRQKVIKRPCVYEVPNDSFKADSNKFKDKLGQLIVRSQGFYENENTTIGNNKEEDEDYIDLTNYQQ